MRGSSVAIERLDHRRLDAGVVHGGVFDLDIHDSVALSRPAEDLVECGDRLAGVLGPKPAARVERLQLGE